MKTTARSAITPVLNFAWFLAIVFFGGQLGPLLYMANDWWHSRPLMHAIAMQAQTGQFIAFSTALLASSAYFVVREYHLSEKIDHRKIKSLLMLSSMVLGFVGMLIAFQLTLLPAFDSARQYAKHWIVYWFSVIVALLWWALQEFAPSAQAEIAKLDSEAEKITELSNTRTTTSGNVTV